MIHFRLKTGEGVVEVIDEKGGVLAIISPDKAKAELKIVSAHFLGIGTEAGPFSRSVDMQHGDGFPIPSVTVKFQRPKPRREKKEDI